MNFYITSTHGHSFQRLHHNPVDLVKESARHLLSSGALQVQTQVADGPLASMNVVVVVLHQRHRSKQLNISSLALR